MMTPSELQKITNRAKHRISIENMRFRKEQVEKFKDSPVCDTIMKMMIEAANKGENHICIDELKLIELVGEKNMYVTLALQEMGFISKWDDIRRGIFVSWHTKENMWRGKE